MNKRLLGKTVLITGASSGLGEHLARFCARDCEQLILIARNKDKLLKMKEQLERDYQAKIITFPFDLKDYHNLDLSHYQVDVLINNAGIGKFKSVDEIKMKEVEEMVNLNLLSLIAITKQVLPSMVKKKSGHIINIASQGGKISTPKSAVYAATKRAVLGFSDSLRMEVKYSGIKVTTVNPGPMKTSFFDYADESGTYLNQVGRWVLDPEKVAQITVKKIFTNTREINLPHLMNLAAKIYAVAPGFVEFVGKGAFYKK